MTLPDTSTSASEVDLHDLNPDEAHIARAAVASHRRNRRRVDAQRAFFDAVIERYHERPNHLVMMHPCDDAPQLAFGVGIGRVLEPMPGDLADLYRAWKNA